MAEPAYVPARGLPSATATPSLSFGQGWQAVESGKSRGPIAGALRRATVPGAVAPLVSSGCVHYPIVLPAPFPGLRCCAAGCRAARAGSQTPVPPPAGNRSLSAFRPGLLRATSGRPSCPSRGGVGTPNNPSIASLVVHTPYSERRLFNMSVHQRRSRLCSFKGKDLV